MLVRSVSVLGILLVALPACGGVTRGLFAGDGGGDTDGSDDGGANGPAVGQDGGSTGSCTTASCPFGCCQGGACVMPSTNAACGAFGMACQDCASLGQTCIFGVCSGGGRRGGSDAGTD